MIATCPVLLHPVFFYDFLLGLVEDVELLPDLDEGLQGPVQVVDLVGCGNLGSDPGLALGNNREEEADGINAFLVESLGEFLGQPGVEQHDRDNRGIAFLQDEAGFLQALSPVLGVLLQLVAALGGGRENLQHLEDAHDYDRGDGVGEQVRPGPLPAHLHDFPPSGHAAARGPAEGLTEGGGDDVNLAHDPVLLVGPPPRFPDETGGVGIVNQEHGVVLFAELDHLVQLGRITVHRENAVGHHQPQPLVLVHLELFLEVGHVGMLESIVHGAAQPDAVDQRGMNQAVGDDDIILGQDGLEHPGVGIHAGREEDGVFRTQELGHLPFQLLVDVLGAADKAHRGHSEAPGFQPLVGGLDHLGMAGQAEVIVGAHVDDLLQRRTGRKFHLDVGRLRRMNEPFFLEQPALLQGLELGLV